MIKSKHLKPDLEKIIMILFEYIIAQDECINAQEEQIRLMKELNEVLLKYNHKLIRQYADREQTGQKMTLRDEVQD